MLWDSHPIFSANYLPARTRGYMYVCLLTLAEDIRIHQSGCYALESTVTAVNSPHTSQASAPRSPSSVPESLQCRDGEEDGRGRISQMYRKGCLPLKTLMKELIDWNDVGMMRWRTNSPKSVELGREVKGNVRTLILPSHSSSPSTAPDLQCLRRLLSSRGFTLLYGKVLCGVCCSRCRKDIRAVCPGK